MGRKREESWDVSFAWLYSILSSSISLPSLAIPLTLSPHLPFHLFLPISAHVPLPIRGPDIAHFFCTPCTLFLSCSIAWCPFLSIYEDNSHCSPSLSFPLIFELWEDCTSDGRMRMECSSRWRVVPAIAIDSTSGLIHGVISSSSEESSRTSSSHRYGAQISFIHSLFIPSD